MLGALGVGKSHLAVGLAIKALDAGMVVYYTTLSHLIADLKRLSSKDIWSAGGESICVLQCW